MPCLLETLFRPAGTVDTFPDAARKVTTLEAFASIFAHGLEKSRGRAGKIFLDPGVAHAFTLAAVAEVVPIAEGVVAKRRAGFIVGACHCAEPGVNVGRDREALVGFGFAVVDIITLTTDWDLTVTFNPDTKSATADRPWGSALKAIGAGASRRVDLKSIAELIDRGTFNRAAQDNGIITTSDNMRGLRREGGVGAHWGVPILFTDNVTLVVKDKDSCKVRAVCEFIGHACSKAVAIICDINRIPIAIEATGLHASEVSADIKRKCDACAIVGVLIVIEPTARLGEVPAAERASVADQPVRAVRVKLADVVRMNLVGNGRSLICRTFEGEDQVTILSRGVTGNAHEALGPVKSERNGVINTPIRILDKFQLAAPLFKLEPDGCLTALVEIKRKPVSLSRTDIGFNRFSNENPFRAPFACSVWRNRAV